VCNCKVIIAPCPKALQTDSTKFLSSQLHREQQLPSLFILNAFLAVGNVKSHQLNDGTLSDKGREFTSIKVCERNKDISARLWTEQYLLQNLYVEALVPVSHDVIIFGDRHDTKVALT
jgi:hypothetical protein